MRKCSAVFMADSPTRSNVRISAGEIYRGISNRWSQGTPSLKEHDASRPIAWAFPTALSFQPHLTRLHGVFHCPETEREWKELKHNFRLYMKAHFASATAPHIEELRRLLSSHLQGGEEPMDLGATTLVGPDLARRVAPTLFKLEDDDGLVSVANLDQIQPGLYRHGELAIFAHPVHRRSLSRWNNLNVPLLEELFSLASLKDATVRLRLDPDAVGLAKSVRAPIELEYWHGPKYSDDLASIPSGVTRHEASDFERDRYCISRTEFWWQSRKGEHILEVEELRNLPTCSSSDSRYGCRYIHSIVNESSNLISHLDGAIREYSEGEIIERMEKLISESGRNTTYTKGWRVDGNIPLGRWKSLIHHYFRNNPLVGEYMEKTAIRETSPAPAKALDSQKSFSPETHLLPPSLCAGEGIRLLLSIHELPDKALEASRVVRLHHEVDYHGTMHTVIDAETVELKKILARQNHGLFIPAQAVSLEYPDRHFSFPLISHSEVAAVDPTLDAIHFLLSAWNRSNLDRIASFALGFLLDDREVRVSFFGHVADIPPRIQLLRELLACKSHEDTVEWVDKAAQSLAGAVVRTDAAPSSDGIVDRLITSAGTLQVTRSKIDASHWVLQGESQNPDRTLFISKVEKELFEAFKAGTIRPGRALLIQDSTCVKCGDSYSTCPCSKALDSDVAERRLDTESPFAFWMD